MRLLRLTIHEPIPGRVLPHMALTHGDDVASRRYRAIVVTTLRQLANLSDTEIQIDCTPDDATEAIRFWLLPQLSEQWRAADDAVYVNAHWRIRFAPPTESPTVIAVGDVLCPWLGARLVHTAMLGLEQGSHRVVGQSQHGRPYLHAHATNEMLDYEMRALPDMPIVETDQDWLDVLASPLGPAVSHALEQA